MNQELQAYATEAIEWIVKRGFSDGSPPFLNGVPIGVFALPGNKNVDGIGLSKRFWQIYEAVQNAPENSARYNQYRGIKDLAEKKNINPIVLYLMLNYVVEAKIGTKKLILELLEKYEEQQMMLIIDTILQAKNGMVTLKLNASEELFDTIVNNNHDPKVGSELIMLEQMHDYPKWMPGYFTSFVERFSTSKRNQDIIDSIEQAAPTRGQLISFAKNFAAEDNFIIPALKDPSKVMNHWRGRTNGYVFDKLEPKIFQFIIDNLALIISQKFDIMDTNNRYETKQINVVADIYRKAQEKK